MMARRPLSSRETGLEVLGKIGRDLVGVGGRTSCTCPTTEPELTRWFNLDVNGVGHAHL